MATYTPNYQLHQWEPEDAFLRADFNEDLKKIDAAIKGVETATEAKLEQKVKLVTGTYVGNGSTQEINLGFQPLAVIVRITSVHPMISARNFENDQLWVTQTGFSVKFSNDHTYNTNEKGTSYLYLAFG